MIDKGSSYSVTGERELVERVVRYNPAGKPSERQNSEMASNTLLIAKNHLRNIETRLPSI